MKIQIKNRWTGAVIYETDAENLGAAVVAAVMAQVNLSGSDLSNSDLRGSNLSDSNLSGSNLRGSNLRGSDLSNSDLRGSDLRDSNLSGSSLRGSDLRGSDLRDSNLRDSNLRDSDLRGSDLRDSNLRDSDLERLLSQRTILPDGELIGWKKLQGGVICKLRIPSNAKRVGGLIDRKCRAEFAVVLEGDGKSQHDGTQYKVGAHIEPDRFDPNPLVECSHGIHFFITRKEAEDYV
jgi:hypothetical protein